MAEGITLQLELLDDVVFSERPATEGAHRGLDHVPGSALLGWTAARLYAELDAGEAWLLFHSGKVRFGNGVPLAPNGRLAWPAPLALHAPKGERWQGEDGRVRAEKVRNLVRAGREQGAQWRQVRDTRITCDGLVHTPARELAMKTAIDPETGRARKHHLYGYEALRAGQRFVARIEADDDVPAHLLDRFRTVLDGAVAHLGRSRAAQYGRVRCVLGEAFEVPEEISGETRELVVWLLADMAAAHEGAPVFAPRPEDLGLPHGRLVPERSFIRARAYAPFNTWRQTRDLERQVITAGSVLVFEMDAPVDPAALPRAFGLWREAGLGHVAINPRLLADEHPVFEAARAPSGEVAPARPDSVLLDWLETIREESEASAAVDEVVEDMVAGLRKLYEAARVFGTAELRLPGKTQWGRVREVAANTADGDALMDRLFGADGPIKAENNDDWNAFTVDEAGRTTTIREWLQARLQRERPALRAHIAVRLARRMADVLAAEEARGGAR